VVARVNNLGLLGRIVVATVTRKGDGVMVGVIRGVLVVARDVVVDVRDVVVVARDVVKVAVVGLRLRWQRDVVMETLVDVKLGLRVIVGWWRCSVRLLTFLNLAFKRNHFAFVCTRPCSYVPSIIVSTCRPWSPI